MLDRSALRDFQELLKEYRLIRNAHARDRPPRRFTPTQYEQSYNDYFKRTEDIINKARRIMGKQEKKQTYGNWRGFITVKLSDDEKQGFTAWDVHDGEVWDGVSTYLTAGYKFSMSYNPTNGTFNCSCTGTQGAGVNEGFTVSAFAPAAYDAVRLTLYKVTVVLPADWTQYQPSPNDLLG